MGGCLSLKGAYLTYRSAGNQNHVSVLTDMNRLMFRLYVGLTCHVPFRAPFGELNLFKH